MVKLKNAFLLEFHFMIDLNLKNFITKNVGSIHMLIKVNIDKMIIKLQKVNRLAYH